MADPLLEFVPNTAPTALLVQMTMRTRSLRSIEPIMHPITPIYECCASIEGKDRNGCKWVLFWLAVALVAFSSIGSILRLCCYSVSHRPLAALALVPHTQKRRVASIDKVDDADIRRHTRMRACSGAKISSNPSMTARPSRCQAG